HPAGDLGFSTARDEQWTVVAGTAQLVVDVGVRRCRGVGRRAFERRVARTLPFGGVDVPVAVAIEALDQLRLVALPDAQQLALRTRESRLATLEESERVQRIAVVDAPDLVSPGRTFLHDDI